jgi:uncharacterized protein YebE (UPF0316 family)
METFDTYTWVTLPLIVFLARFVDVTLGTMRIIFLSRGRKFLAPALGFVEVFIWITVVSQIVGGAKNNLLAYFAYAAGFAVGNYFGMVIEDKLAIGTLVIRAILPRNGNELTERLREAGYGVTFVDGHGASGDVVLIYTVVMRKELGQVISIIQNTAPKAFFTVEELRSVQQGIFPVRASSIRADLFRRKKE